MPVHPVARRRLTSQGLSAPESRTPLDVVSRLGALQAQDYLAALWAIGARLPGATETTVERAIGERTIVRSWPLRGTLHFVPAADLRWMLALTKDRLVAASTRRHQALELDEATFARSRRIVTRTLRGGRCLSRRDVLACLEAGAVATRGQRGYHILWRLAQDGLLCFGPHQGRQPTFVLLDEWIPDRTGRLDRDAALGELARRYFNGHGPATMHDFAWWSGLTMSETRTGTEAAGEALRCERIANTVYWCGADTQSRGRAPGVRLLAAFDEYVVGYKDRSAVLDPAHARRIVPGGNGVFQPLLVINGQVAGTWKQERRRTATRLRLFPFRPVRPADRRAIAAETARYGRFLQTPVLMAGSE